MAKQSNRDKLLLHGLRVVRERGFWGASVRDIVQAAGVPQGSFTNHFVSKEAFCLEVLELFVESVQAVVARTLKNDAFDPLVRVYRYIEATVAAIAEGGIGSGCLIGNSSIEGTERSDAIRQRLIEIHEDIEHAIAACFTAAVTAGAMPASTVPDSLAGFVFGSLEGAIMQAKVRRSVGPLERFKDVMAVSVLGFANGVPTSSQGLSAAP
jgi:TetR/AcrR family transcriptional repressor of nem operon